MTDRGNQSLRKGSAASGDELRCECGSLIARWTTQGLELKCRRCKRRIYLQVKSEKRSSGARAPP